MESAQETQNEKFKKDLFNIMIPELNNQVHTLTEESVEPQYLKEESNMYDMIEQLDKKMETFKEFQERSQRFNYYQEVLGTPSTVFDNIDELREQLFNRHLMWHSLKEWIDMTEVWIKTVFGQIAADDISAASEKYTKIVNRLDKTLPTNPI